ncbi:hypothetical protein [Streptomyces tricolor]|uniref:hypothetical protein n=1 Tax=Streptomyces tricolor TaxID=68277 RepID=UPI0036E2FBB6
MHSHGQHEILGTAYSDHDLIVFLEGVDVADLEAVLDDPRWVEWLGGQAHESTPPDVREGRWSRAPVRLAPLRSADQLVQ